MKRGCSLEVILEEIVEESPPLLSLDSHLTRNSKAILRRTRSLELLSNAEGKRWEHDLFEDYRSRPGKLLDEYQESETSSGVCLGNVQDSDDSFSTSSRLNDVHQDSDDSSLSTKGPHYESLQLNSLSNDPCTLSVTELTQRLERSLEIRKAEFPSCPKRCSPFGSDYRTPSPDSEFSAFSKCSDYLQDYTPKDMLENKRVVIVENKERETKSDREENLPLWIQKGIMINPQSWHTNDLSTVVKKILSLGGRHGDSLSHTKNTVNVLTNSHLLRQRQVLKRDGKGYPSNLELYEEELPKPDTVREVRNTFENLARSSKRQEVLDRISVIKSNPTSRIFRYDTLNERPQFTYGNLGRIPNPLKVPQLQCVMDHRGGHKTVAPAAKFVKPEVNKVCTRAPFKQPPSGSASHRQAADSDSAWSDSSDPYYDNDASSESSDISDFPEPHSFREVSPEVLERIRSYGTSVTYYGGKIVAYKERNKQCLTQDIIDEILKRKSNAVLIPNTVPDAHSESPKPKIISCTPKQSPEGGLKETQRLVKTESVPVPPSVPKADRRPIPAPRKLTKTNSQPLPDPSIKKDYSLDFVRPRPKDDMEFEEFEFSENPIKDDNSPGLAPVVLSPALLKDTHDEGNSVIFDFRGRHVDAHVLVNPRPQAKV